MDFVGNTPMIKALLDRVDTIAASDAAVVIFGETGTGKEVIAQRLHRKGPRVCKPFVAVNCSAFPDTLLEAELFGYEKGAFTGAVNRRQGRFEAAQGGTLFLDEVGEIPLMAQAKLLRVLQEGVIEPLGTNTSVPVDVRLVSATHRDLKAQIQQGTFREDLYYRLNVLDVYLPPLRERLGDLPLLIEHFIAKYAAGQNMQLDPQVWALLSRYEFPGNVRELEHALQHAVVISRDRTITIEHLPRDIIATFTNCGESHTPNAWFQPLSNALKEFEREYLLRALEHCEGKKAAAAELLGISRKNLWEKLKMHGVELSL